jgi:hypothetical protein
VTYSSKLSKQLTKRSDGIGNNQARVALAETVSQLNNNLHGLSQVCQTNFEEFAKNQGELLGQLEATQITVRAIIEELGIRDAVMGRCAQIQKDIQTQNNAKFEEQVKASVEAGNIVTTDVVGKETVVGHTVVNEAGESDGTGTRYVVFEDLTDEVRQNVEGKKVGDLIAIGNDYSLKIEAIYQPVPVANPEA